MFSVRRFGKGTKKLALTNHGQWIEDYVFDYFLKETEPDCSLYAKDGTEKKIHKVSDLFMYSRVWNKRTPLNKRSPWKIWQKE